MLKTEIKDMEKVEDDLIKKEITLESKLKEGESWGEKFGEEHHVHMNPLKPHFPKHEFDFKKRFDQMKEKIENKIEKMTESLFP